MFGIMNQSVLNFGVFRTKISAALVLSPTRAPLHSSLCDSTILENACCTVVFFYVFAYTGHRLSPPRHVAPPTYVRRGVWLTILSHLSLAPEQPLVGTSVRHAQSHRGLVPFPLGRALGIPCLSPGPRT